MRLLDRYLLREFLVPLGYCLVGFLILWVAADFFNELNNLQEMRLGNIVKYYVFMLPSFLPVALPVALLLALLYALTNHARHNEITAVRAAGVSLWRICLPYSGVGMLTGVILFLMNEYCAPGAAEKAEQIMDRKAASGDRQVYANLAFFNAQDQRFWRIGTYNQRTGEMIRPHVVWELPGGLKRTFYAEQAVRSNGVWVFYQVREFRQSPTNELQVPLPSAPVMALPEFTETPEMIKSEISINGQFGRKRGTYQADISLGEIRDYLRLHPKPERGIRNWLQTKMHGRFAAAFTCLVVVLIAVPFAAASGRRNVFVGVAASITIFFTYFLLLQLGFAFGQVGRVPPWLGAWLPNIVFGLAGLWMTMKAR
jgi:lipopolysaccharide export system permease protein